MIKKDELSNPTSCINRAEEDEPTFVLLARDPAAPDAIHEWIHRRVQLGRNSSRDIQIQDAAQIIRDMVNWRRRHRGA